MLYNEHNPPHFHAYYGNYHVMVEIKTGIIEGRFPKRALKAVQEWLELHQDELMENWERAACHEELKAIDPLE